MDSSDPQPLLDESALEESKLRALAEFAAGAGHEINNPVATIVGHVQLLLAGETDPDRRNALATIGAQAYRIRDMIGDVMLFARPPLPCVAAVDLAALVRETAAKLEPGAIAAKYRLEVAAAEPIPLSADAVQLQVVISNLIRNSIAAVPPGGAIQVVAKLETVNGRACALLKVTDNGPGLSAIEREHLFDPFFSGRQAGRGLGFGLSKCWRIVGLHGGKIDVRTPTGGGVEMTVTLPVGHSS